MDIGQLRVGKGYLMVTVTVGQQGKLNPIVFAFLSSSKPKENLNELHIIVRTTGFNFIFMDMFERLLRLNVFICRCKGASALNIENA